MRASENVTPSLPGHDTSPLAWPLAWPLLNGAMRVAMQRCLDAMQAALAPAAAVHGAER